MVTEAHRHEPKWFSNYCRCGHRTTDEEHAEILRYHLGELRRAVEETFVEPVNRAVVWLECKPVIGPVIRALEWLGGKAPWR